MFLANEFITLAVVHFLAIASPGPNVISTVSNSFTYGFRAGVQTSLGVAIGNLFHIALGIFGITALVTSFPKVGIAVSLVGILYLIYLGILRIRRGLDTKEKTDLLSTKSDSENFLASGIIINITNVKGALFFLMAFSTLISPDNALSVKVFYGLWMVIVNFLFLSFLAWVFSKGATNAQTFNLESTVNVVGGVAYLIVASFLFMALIRSSGLSL